LISARFANPEIHDTTRRVAFDGSSRHAGFLHPIIRDALSVDAPIEGLALVEALWARMCAGFREDGSLIEPNDPYWDVLLEHGKCAKGDPSVWLSQDQFYGDLGHNARFSESFSRWLKLVWAEGAETAIETYLED